MGPVWTAEPWALQGAALEGRGLQAGPQATLDWEVFEDTQDRGMPWDAQGELVPREQEQGRQLLIDDPAQQRDRSRGTDQHHPPAP